ncbi:hypothetical protein CR513_21472, partial [Mucuna pruriens]
MSLPEDNSIIGTKWIIRNKLDGNAHNHMRLHQIDVSSVLLNDIINKEVGTILFHKNNASQFIIVQIYVDDIIFGHIDDSLYEEFSELMQKEFYISMMGKLKFFLVRLLQKHEYTHVPISVLNLNDSSKKVDQTAYKEVKYIAAHNCFGSSINLRTTTSMREGSIAKIGWQEAFGGDDSINDILLRPNFEEVLLSSSCCERPLLSFLQEIVIWKEQYCLKRLGNIQFQSPKNAKGVVEDVKLIIMEFSTTGEASKRSTPIVKTTRVVVKNKKKLVLPTKSEAYDDDDDDEDDDAPLISRKSKKMHVANEQGITHVDPIICPFVPRKKIFKTLSNRQVKRTKVLLTPISTSIVAETLNQPFIQEPGQTPFKTTKYLHRTLAYPNTYLKTSNKETKYSNPNITIFTKYTKNHPNTIFDLPRDLKPLDEATKGLFPSIEDHMMNRLPLLDLNKYKEEKDKKAPIRYLSAEEKLDTPTMSKEDVTLLQPLLAYHFGD